MSANTGALRHVNEFAGQVTVGQAERLKSSTDSPSSDPVPLKSFQRIQNVDPSAIDNPVIVELMAVLLGEELPSYAPTVPVVTGAVKSKASASFHVPVVRLVALVLY